MFTNLLILRLGFSNLLNLCIQQYVRQVRPKRRPWHRKGRAPTRHAQKSDPRQIAKSCIIGKGSCILVLLEAYHVCPHCCKLPRHECHLKLQCLAVRCSVLQCVAVHCTPLRAPSTWMPSAVAVCRNLMQCVGLIRADFKCYNLTHSNWGSSTTEGAKHLLVA